MQRTDRLFEVIQLLRGAATPVSSSTLAAQLEVSQRTVYRDIATLQSMRVPIVGEAGVGYVMAEGYDLPPLNFSRDEVPAIVVGLSLVSRTGDATLQKASTRALSKIDGAGEVAKTLHVSDWGARNIDPGVVETLHGAIWDQHKLSIEYVDLEGARTTRTIAPLAMTYYVQVAILAAWCDLRGDFRHFRIDRIRSCVSVSASFADDAAELRARLSALTAARADE